MNNTQNSLITFTILILISFSNLYAEFRQGMYLRTDITVSSKFDSLMIIASQAGINNIVFDVKDMKGKTFIDIEGCPTMISRPGDLKVDICQIINKIHGYKMTATARMVAFHNTRAAGADSLVCPKDSLGNRWFESARKGAQWLDPSLPAVQNDLFSLIDEVVKAGIDEIQFDYMRFPTQGNISDARFEFMRENERQIFRDSTYIQLTKMDIIESFLFEVKKRYNKYNVDFTADIFAIVSWQNSQDIEATGQDISRMSRHLSAIHPMTYSSHFNDEFGFRHNVHNEPYDIIFKSVKRTLKKINSQCEVIPYIQANSWQVNYNKDFIAAQVAACRDSGAEGFIFWNSSIRYETTLNWLGEINTNQ